MKHIASWMTIIINKTSSSGLTDKDRLERYSYSPTYNGEVIKKWILREYAVYHRCNMNEYHPTLIIKDQRKLVKIIPSNKVRRACVKIRRELKGLIVSKTDEYTWIESV